MLRALRIKSKESLVTVLTAREKEIAGPFVHYAVGTTAGAMYGLAAEQRMDLRAITVRIRVR
jgi:hypothetical protein